MSKIIVWCLKAGIACLIAIIISSLVFMVYDNIPVHFDNVSGATDYKWEESKLYSKWTEGFAWGKTNNDGFNNQMNFGDKPINVLLMGSSHSEAFQVPQNKTTVSYLNNYLDDNTTAYSIATSGHTLLTQCKNFDAALKTYSPSDYVVIETPNVIFSTDRIKAVNDGTLNKIPSAGKNVTYYLQKIPYVRRLYHQISNSEKASVAESASEISEITVDFNTQLDLMLKNVAEKSEKYEVKLMIVYHCPFILNADGTAFKNTDDDEYVKTFQSLCKKNGIIFVEMTDTFLYEYNNHDVLPYGFTNSAVNSGHLNAVGERLVAEKIYDVIAEEKS